MGLETYLLQDMRRVVRGQGIVGHYNLSDLHTQAFIWRGGQRSINHHRMKMALRCWVEPVAAAKEWTYMLQMERRGYRTGFWAWPRNHYRAWYWHLWEQMSGTYLAWNWLACLVAIEGLAYGTTQEGRMKFPAIDTALKHLLREHHLIGYLASACSHPNGQLKSASGKTYYKGYVYVGGGGRSFPRIGRPLDRMITKYLRRSYDLDPSWRGVGGDSPEDDLTEELQAWHWAERRRPWMAHLPPVVSPMEIVKTSKELIYWQQFNPSKHSRSVLAMVADLTRPLHYIGDMQALYPADSAGKKPTGESRSWNPEPGVIVGHGPLGVSSVEYDSDAEIAHRISMGPDGIAEGVLKFRT